MARASVVLLGSLLAVGALAGLADARSHHARAAKHVRPTFRPTAEDMAEVPHLPAAMKLQRTAAARGVTLYVNGDGGTLTGGWDDAANDVSSIAWGDRQSVDVPAWKGGGKAWGKVIACVRERFADFDVDVVTDRPSRGAYTMIMVGGQPSLLGYGDGVGGVAPYTGEVLRNAVGYVFAAALEYDVEQTCVAIIHEAGHTMGLDHEYLCEDPMSYLWGCGEKRWQDQDAPCGENEERSCGNGQATQNSYRQLAAGLGTRDGEALPPADDPPADDPPADDPPADDPPANGDEPTDWGSGGDDAGGWDAGADDAGADDAPADDDCADGDWQGRADDAAAPTVSIDPTADQMAGNGWIEIDVRAASDAGLADVELGWASDTAQYVFSCAAMPDDAPATCRQDGDTFRFSIYVGTGLRAMAARATDVDGAQTVTDVRVLDLT